jgi:hypothetical protein
MAKNKKHKKYSSVSFDEDVKPSSVDTNEELPIVEDVENDINEKEYADTSNVDAKTETDKVSDPNTVVIVKSDFDLDNEKKIKMILKKDESYDLTYSELLSQFITLFENFNKIRIEYNKYYNSVQRKINSYQNQHSYGPMWN